MRDSVDPPWHRCAMEVATVLGELQTAGSEQTCRTYKRHGAPEPMFGVLFSNLRGLAKRIGTDHRLAKALWVTGNTDARTLAMLVADPKLLDTATADGWASSIRYHAVIDQVAAVVARSPIAIDRMAQWVGSNDEFVAQCGWSVMANLAQHVHSIADAAFTPYLSVVERRIHDAPNRARQAMYSALIAIGGRSDELSAPAIAAAKRIGPVTIDHGDTACETPDAVAYIGKMRARATTKTTLAAPRVKARAVAATKPAVAAKKKPTARAAATKKTPARKSR